MAAGEDLPINMSSTTQLGQALAEGLPTNMSSIMMLGQAKGPILIDGEECRCALQEELDIKAWRCIADLTHDIYSGQRGKWFFAVDQTSQSSLNDPPNSDTNPPNLTRSYIIKGNGQDMEFAILTPSDKVADLEDGNCTGSNDTEASSALYLYIALATSLVNSSTPCWQPWNIPLTIQNASEWNATGCNLGFLCKYASPFA